MIADVQSRCEERGSLMIRALNLLDVCTARHLGVATTYRAATDRLREDILTELER